MPDEPSPEIEEAPKVEDVITMTHEQLAAHEAKIRSDALRDNESKRKWFDAIFDKVEPKLDSINKSVQEFFDRGSKRSFRTFKHVYWLVVGCLVVIVGLSLALIAAGEIDHGLGVLQATFTFIAGFLAGMGILRNNTV